MILENCGFKLLKRGFKDSLVLIPGWATDYRIFSAIELNYNYILPAKLDPFNFKDNLLKLLEKESIKKISLFGWSLGGFLASDFALENPETVDELILLGIRKKYNREALDIIRKKIYKNKEAFLYKFYLECFSDSDRLGLAWFKDYLLREYLKEMKLEYLTAGLDYFSRASINPDSFTPVKRIRIFHGSQDRIAPFKEAEELSKGFEQAKFISMSGAGHILFLNRNFTEIFNNG